VALLLCLLVNEFQFNTLSSLVVAVAVVRQEVVRQEVGVLEVIATALLEN